MLRLHPAGVRLAALLILIPLSLTLLRPARGQAQDQGHPGQFFTVEQPLSSDEIERLQVATQAEITQEAAAGQNPILVFVFRPGQSTFGVSLELAKFISKQLGGARRTVAYVPESLSGYAVLPALACDEIVLGSGAALGPITPSGEPVERDMFEFLRGLAEDKGREADLLIGMLDPTADLRRVVTANRQVHYVLAENLPGFARKLAERGQMSEVVEDQAAWEPGQPGILSAQRAREEGLAKLLAETPAEVAAAYNLRGAADDPTLGQPKTTVWIEITGPIDDVKVQYVKQRMAKARERKVNLVFFRFDSQGGEVEAADTLADLIARIKDMKTVAYIADDATGVAALVALACDEIVFHDGGRMGDVRQEIEGRGGFGRDLSEGMVASLADRAEAIAEENGHPPAVARAMIDPETEVVEAKDNQTGAVGLVSRRQIAAEPQRYDEREVLKRADEEVVLTVRSDDAVRFGLTRQVVADEEEFKALFGLRNQDIPKDGPTWVDSLVTTLNTGWMSGLLLFIGMFMLILELKLPGIGLPAITSALAFLLFFWSHYLSGTADQLEIMLFLVGLICLAMELFVFPGFGVFGMSGILLILVSVVMASHTFVWPTQAYEYRQMGHTLIQLALSLVAVVAGAVILGRYFPSLPLFNRIVLQPEVLDEVSTDPTAKPSPSQEATLLFLIGETGRTTTALRPAGKARFGELLVDVTADGFYIEPDSLVEVIEVQGPRVIVRRVV